MSIFLQNTKRRHRQYMHLCSKQIATATLELHERLCFAADRPEVRLACCLSSAKINISGPIKKLLLQELEIVVPDLDPAAPADGLVHKLRRGFAVALDRYANFMGSIGGLLLSAALLGLWLGLGKILGYNNSNWWLIIGTWGSIWRISVHINVQPIPLTFNTFICAGTRAWLASSMPLCCATCCATTAVSWRPSAMPLTRPTLRCWQPWPCLQCLRRPGHRSAHE